MNCRDCWYCTGDDTLLCVNPKSEYFGNEVKPDSSCPYFSDQSRLDPEAKNVILDQEIVHRAIKMRRELAEK